MKYITFNHESRAVDVGESGFEASCRETWWAWRFAWLKCFINRNRSLNLLTMAACMEPARCSFSRPCKLGCGQASWKEGWEVDSMWLYQQWPIGHQSTHCGVAALSGFGFLKKDCQHVRHGFMTLRPRLAGLWYALFITMGLLCGQAQRRQMLK